MSFSSNTGRISFSNIAECFSCSRRLSESTAERSSRGSIPLTERTAIPASILLFDPAILTLKNSSKLLAKIAKNLALSKIGRLTS